jgi:hypothetical protein
MSSIDAYCVTKKKFESSKSHSIAIIFHSFYLLEVKQAYNKYLEKTDRDK